MPFWPGIHTSVITMSYGDFAAQSSAIPGSDAVSALIPSCSNIF